MDDEARNDRDQGGMTDATGELTPDTDGEKFVPAARRAMNEPDIAHATSADARRRRALNQTRPDSPGSLDELPKESLAPNDRDGGYGSEHGLAPNDPAYAFEERPVDDTRTPPPIEDGDERSDSDSRY